MTPEEALQILDAAAAEAPLPRFRNMYSQIGHVQVQQAAQSLAEFIRNAKGEDVGKGEKG